MPTINVKIRRNKRKRAKAVVDEIRRDNTLKDDLTQTVEDTMVRNGRSGGSLVIGKR